MAQNPQDTSKEASRGANAKRFGKFGLLAGAVLGLLQGGGIAGMVQMGVMMAGVGAVGGAAAGDKLNPLADKLMGMIPGLKKAQGQGKAAPQAEPEMVQTQGPVFRETSAEKGTAAPAVEQENFRAVDSVDPSLLAQARQQAGNSVRTAGEDMDPSTPAMSAAGLPQEWVSRQGSKQPTHEGPSVRQ